MVFCDIDFKYGSPRCGEIVFLLLVGLCLGLFVLLACVINGGMHLSCVSFTILHWCMNCGFNESLDGRLA